MRRALLLIPVCLLLAPVPARAADAPNDEYYKAGYQWGLTKIGGDAAWTVGRGAGAVVAVIDTGVDLEHPDLRERLLPGRDFVDDPEGEGDPTDENGHGTLVAGVIAASTGNRIGIASVAPDARIMPIRVLDGKGEGTSESVADGIDWAVEHGADVVNLSLAQEENDEGPDFLPGGILSKPEVDDAIKRAAAAGAVVVIAAGNDSDGGRPETSYDATVPGVLVVGAGTIDDKRAASSNYGEGLDLLAPGGGSAKDASDSGCTEQNSIVSTWWDRNEDESSYGGGCGSSMAVAFVSGVAASLRALGRSNESATTRILETADDLGAGGRDDKTGHGRLNAARALGARRPAVRAQASPRPTRASPAASPPPTGRKATKQGEVEPVAPVRPAPTEPPSRAAPADGTGPARPVTAAAALVSLVVLGHAWRLALRAPVKR